MKEALMGTMEEALGRRSYKKSKEEDIKRAKKKI